jgi:hypothetical protein
VFAASFRPGACIGSKFLWILSADGKSINQIEALAVLGQNGREIAWDDVSKFP